MELHTPKESWCSINATGYKKRKDGGKFVCWEWSCWRFPSGSDSFDSSDDNKRMNVNLLITILKWDKNYIPSQTLKDLKGFYIFRTAGKDALKKNMLSKANKRWKNGRAEFWKLWFPIPHPPARECILYLDKTKVMFGSISKKRKALF